MELAEREYKITSHKLGVTTYPTVEAAMNATAGQDWELVSAQYVSTYLYLFWTRSIRR